MIFAIIKGVSGLILITLSVAYGVEWQLGRVKLGQSLSDIKTVAKNIIAHFHKPKP